MKTDAALLNSIHDCHILIADDSRVNREVLLAYLNHAGWYNIACVEDGQQALDYIDKNDVDIILLDLSMPVIDGYEVCASIRSDPRHYRMPVIVQTGFTGQDERRRAFLSGATDFVIKPVFREELLARVRLQLENRLLMQRLERYHDRLSSELDTARQMQARLVPDLTQTELALSGLPLQMASHYRPVTELGGDIWGLRRLSPERLAFYAADFSGHGVAPAIHTFKLSTFINRLPKRVADQPGATLSAVAEEFAPGFTQGQHLAIFYGVYDSVAETVMYSAVGMPSPLLLNQEHGDDVSLVDTSGVPIGLNGRSTSSPPYQEHTLKFAPGAQLLLYSDGLLDGTTTPERLAASLRESDLPGPNAIIGQTLAASQIGSRNPNASTDDDVTVLALSRLSA